MSQPMVEASGVKRTVFLAQGVNVESIDSPRASSLSRRTHRNTELTRSGSIRRSIEKVVSDRSESSSAKTKACRDCWYSWNRSVCDSWRFSFVTTLLTFYALFGDDFRIAATHKDVDEVFNILTIITMAVFSFEISAACFGREGYFLGFFFILDLVSTVTLALDLTWVANFLLCSGNEESEEASKTSKAGRAGARASRTVRIIRLLRLVKLYKTYKAAVEKKAMLKRAGAAADAGDATPGEEGNMGDTDQEILNKINDQLPAEEAAADSKEEDEEDANKSETRVGKKLSEMTTRRVIVLVLVMLFCMPQFSPAGQDMVDFQTSADLGMAFVYERWRRWCPINASNPSALPLCLKPSTEIAKLSDGSDLEAEDRRRALRAWYEEYLLSFIYQHHAGDFMWSLCWVGITSSVLYSQSPAQLAADHGGAHPDTILASLARLNQEMHVGDRVRPFNEWDAHYIDPAWVLPLPPLSEKVKEKLAQPWVERCNRFSGVAVSTLISAQRPTYCSVDRDLRCQEVEMFQPAERSKEEKSNMEFMFVFDRREATRLEARLSILQTVFICFAVGMGSMCFANDADDLLLNPIQRMIAKMETIKDNPLEAMKLGDIEYRREEMENAKRKEELANKSRLYQLFAACERRASQPMETVILEKTIIKLGGFLILGFGEAGAEIIGRNLRGDHTVELDANAPGQLVNAIIGICGIRDFPAVLASLQEQVTVFVNQVGEIVHGHVDSYHGAPNKNLGGSFILVWRLSGHPKAMRQKLADMAIMALMRIVCAVARSVLLSEFLTHPALLQRIPNFRPQLGFGMHCGTVAECAVGSEYKLDPLYLSQNVKVASQLEVASCRYATQILISHFMVGLVSHEMAMMCRLIDHVSLPGSKQPLRLFTVDLDTAGLAQVDDRSFKKNRVIKNKFKLRQIREVMKSEKWTDEWSTLDEFNSDEDLLAMRQVFSTDFFLRFSTGYRNYEAGQWKAARDLFVTCHYSLTRHADSFVGIGEDDWPVDGPTVALLSFMRETNNRPPEGWPGFRKLHAMAMPAEARTSFSS
eukprot:TRINITY_DN11134_c0_g1_i1.p1 TRINITY_DN11134_c0_g1~~TRINITY_DN11134_c0_g1_i1.p1  ORF type:complete len:1042 (-),score=199.43 TRINITY_DN11134_c0_g1_i1:141-3266(-)